jgi:hypothetical protein
MYVVCVYTYICTYYIPCIYTYYVHACILDHIYTYIHTHILGTHIRTYTRTHPYTHAYLYAHTHALFLNKHSPSESRGRTWSAPFASGSKRSLPCPCCMCGFSGPEVLRNAEVPVQTKFRVQDIHAHTWNDMRASMNMKIYVQIYTIRQTHV